MITSLEHCRNNNRGTPPPPMATRITASKKATIVTLWPRNSIIDKLEAVGLRGEIVLGDENAEQMSLPQATVGGVAGILGAGNIDAPIEILCQMFSKVRVCIYKPNPINQKQQAMVAKILEPLVQSGYIAFIIGGADVGSALVKHACLDEVVLTGSIATFKKIQPLLIGKNTPICAELGGVNPWIVVPGTEWNKGSVDRHARHLAFAKLANNGHTCAAPQVVIVKKDWPWRREFLDRVRFWLGQHAGSPPFYPGSEEIYGRFKDLSNAEVIHGENVFDKQQHPILIPDVSVDDESEDSIFTCEAFCPVLAEVPIDCPNEDAMTFLRSATDFCHQRCSGSLTVNILIPDKERTTNASEFDELLSNMPWGIVGVNIWPAFGHSMPMLVWGAPSYGHAQSFTGFIGNAHLYKNPAKAVVRAPFDWVGRRALCVMPPRKTELVFSRLAKYKLQPNVLTQTMLFMALFVGL